MKTPSRITQLQKNPGTFHAASMDKAPSVSPRNPLPASPMKILAGGKFQTRNPSTQESRRTGAADPVSSGAASQYSSAAPKDTVVASTPAMPSMPSMKL